MWGAWHRVQPRRATMAPILTLPSFVITGFILLSVSLGQFSSHLLVELSEMPITVLWCLGNQQLPSLAPASTLARHFPIPQLSRAGDTEGRRSGEQGSLPRARAGSSGWECTVPREPWAWDRDSSRGLGWQPLAQFHWETHTSARQEWLAGPPHGPCVPGCRSPASCRSLNRPRRSWIKFEYANYFPMHFSNAGVLNLDITDYAND